MDEQKITETLKKVWATVKEKPVLLVVAGIAVALFGYFQMKSKDKEVKNVEPKI